MLFRKGAASPEFEQDDPHAETAIDTDLADFLTENAADTDDYVCRLFRRARLPGQREKCQWVCTWRGEIPDYEEIATRFGPGSYRLNLIYTNVKTRVRSATSRRVEIDPAWAGAEQQGSGLRPNMLGGSAAEIMMAQMNQQSQQNAQMMVEFAKTVVQSVAGQQRGGMDITSLSDSLGRVLMQQTKQQLDLVNSITRAQIPQLQQAEQDSDEDQSEGGWVPQILQMIMRGWEMYKTHVANNPAGAAAFLKGHLKTPGVAEQVQYAMAHPDQYRLLYDQFRERTGVDEGSLEEFISGLGLPLPYDPDEAPAGE